MCVPSKALYHVGQPLRNTVGKRSTLISSLSVLFNTGSTECFCSPVPRDLLITLMMRQRAGAPERLRH